MELLFIDGLPPSIGKGGILRLLIEVGKLNKERIGKIDLNGGLATVEIPDGRAARLVRLLDGYQVETRYVRVWQQAKGHRHPYFAQLRRWLAMEAKAEQQQAQSNQNSRSEHTLTRLVIRAEEMGLGGRIMVKLTPRNEQARLPFSRLSPGSPVLLSEEGVSQPQSWRGVVSRLSSKICEIALNQPPESEANSFRVDLASDEISRQRMQRALTRVESASSNRTAVLRDIILGEQPASFVNKIPSDLTAIRHLNPSQQAAVCHALVAEDIAIIHGPPGTGKTTTVTALIRTAVTQGSRVLACAPSNLAVDNMAEQLVAAGVPLVRLGHPVRILPQLQAYTLDALMQQQGDYQVALKLRKEAFGMRDQAGKYRRARPAPGEKQSLRNEANTMLDEARQLEARAVEMVLDQAAVILATLTAIDSTILGQRRFDLCVIDEAGQSTEPATWIPVVRSQKLVLAGDHQQLPPTIISQQAEKEGFGISLLEQLMLRDGAQIARRLDVQYRMHKQIMDFSSAEFYAGSLQADVSVESHLLSDLPGVVGEGGDLVVTAVTFIDTAGAGYDDMQPRDSNSRCNPEEAAFVVKKVGQLLDANVPAASIAVITPYSAQVELLREQLPDVIEIGSVDGFQGREKEAVIISLVRSNIKGEVGFLAETRRMNVALTRARRKLIVIGDSATITADPFYVRLIDYFESIGAYHSVWEELY